MATYKKPTMLKTPKAAKSPDKPAAVGIKAINAAKPGKTPGKTVRKNLGAMGAKIGSSLMGKK